jgi:hypothetical protein
MLQNGVRERLHVVGHDEITPADRGMCTGGREQL